MNKWNELEKHICQRIEYLESLARASAAKEYWDLYHDQQGRANEIRAILAVMDGIEEALAPEHPQAQEFSGPGIGERDDLSTW